jgi:hypothetical protein
LCVFCFLCVCVCGFWCVCVFVWGGWFGDVGVYVWVL